jgi:hypothetical protein
MTKKEILIGQIGAVAEEIDHIKGLYVNEWGITQTSFYYSKSFTIAALTNVLEKAKKMRDEMLNSKMPSPSEKQINCIIKFKNSEMFKGDFKDITDEMINNINKYQATQLIGQLICINNMIYNRYSTAGALMDEENELDKMMNCIFNRK